MLQFLSISVRDEDGVADVTTRFTVPYLDNTLGSQKVKHVIDALDSFVISMSQLV